MKLGGKSYNNQGKQPNAKGSNTNDETGTASWMKPSKRHTYPLTHPYWDSVNVNPVTTPRGDKADSMTKVEDSNQNESNSTATPIKSPAAAKQASTTASARIKSKDVIESIELTRDMKAVFAKIMPLIELKELTPGDVCKVLKAPEQVSLIASIAAKMAASTSNNDEFKNDEHAETEHLASHWRAANVKTLVFLLNNPGKLKEMRDYVISQEKIQWDEGKVVMETLGDAL